MSADTLLKKDGFVLTLMYYFAFSPHSDVVKNVTNSISIINLDTHG